MSVTGTRPVRNPPRTLVLRVVGHGSVTPGPRYCDSGPPMRRLRSPDDGLDGSARAPLGGVTETTNPGRPSARAAGPGRRVRSMGQDVEARMTRGSGTGRVATRWMAPRASGPRARERRARERRGERPSGLGPPPGARPGEGRIRRAGIRRAGICRTGAPHPSRRDPPRHRGPQRPGPRAASRSGRPRGPAVRRRGSRR